MAERRKSKHRKSGEINTPLETDKPHSVTEVPVKHSRHRSVKESHPADTDESKHRSGTRSHSRKHSKHKTHPKHEVTEEEGRTHRSSSPNNAEEEEQTRKSRKRKTVTDETPEKTSIAPKRDDSINPEKPRKGNRDETSKRSTVKSDKRSKHRNRSDKAMHHRSVSHSSSESFKLQVDPYEHSDRSTLGSGFDQSRVSYTALVEENATFIVELPIKVLAILVELHLLWWLIQLIVFIWITTVVDIKLRIRSPVEEFPGYTSPRMPWFPGQLAMRDRLYVVWFSLAFVHLPAMLYHMSKFIDLKIKTQPHRKSTTMPIEKAWFLNDRYTRLQKVTPRQVLNSIVLALALLLWIYYVFVFLCDTFHPMQDAYWDRAIDKWISDLQRYYFLQFPMLSRFIPKSHQIQSNHIPDDGKATFLIIDLLQTMFECCGRREGVNDWNAEHVYRPKNHTYRKAMSIPILYERAHYLMPTLQNQSVPFSCCRWKHTTSALSSVPCDHILVRDKRTLYDRGCVPLLSQFIRFQWMEAHMVPLLFVILTMIPQLFLLLTLVEPQQLKKQWHDATISLSEYIHKLKNELQLFGRTVFSVFSKSNSRFSSRTRQTFAMMEDDGYEEDYYKVVRAEVAASEREIYEKRKNRHTRGPDKKKRGSNWKPSPLLESKTSIVDHRRKRIKHDDIAAKTE